MLQVTVAVVDSGVDSTHPDLAYAGGQTWVVEPSDKRPGDMVDAGVDFYGHGKTHRLTAGCACMAVHVW
jgi:subtilisin family serine protease